jgi:DNA-3-methyladenine glycosylase
VDAVALARFLIGQYWCAMPTRAAPAGASSRRSLSRRRCGGARVSRRDAAQPLALLERGHAYVYFIYGCWYAFNVSAETRGVGAGVLVRALVPRDGVALMAMRRGTPVVHDLARGPGRLRARWRSTAPSTGSTCARPDLCGSAPTAPARPRSA